MDIRKNAPIKAILFDMDGVLYIGDDAIEDAGKSVRDIRATGFVIAGVTNTTTQPRRMIAEKLARLNIPIAQADIYTPAALAVQTIANKSAKLYVRESLLEDFQGVHCSDNNPDFIVMGDIGGEGYPPEILLEIFRFVMNGAKVLALHKNRFWQKPDGLHLDIGTFIASIEYATSTEAMILGKPSSNFFLGVCAALDVKPTEALMIGDDIESDIAGAHHAGLTTALVKTGKYRADFVAATGIKADIILPSVAALPQTLSQN